MRKSNVILILFGSISVAMLYLPLLRLAKLLRRRHLKKIGRIEQEILPSTRYIGGEG